MPITLHTGSSLRIGRKIGKVVHGGYSFRYSNLMYDMIWCAMMVMKFRCLMSVLDLC